MALLDWLLSPVTLFFIQTSVLELLGFATGIWTVWLCSRNKLGQWPTGVLNSAIYLFVFWNVALYADASLMVVYILSCFWGWYNWRKGGKAHEELPTRQTNLWPFKPAPKEEKRFDNWRNSLVLTLVGMAILWFWMGTAVDRFTTSDVAFWDAGTTAISLAAQYLLVRRLVENWYAWITVDFMYIGLYWYKDLFFTSFLYVIFIVLCILGIIKWHKDIKRDASTA